MLNTSFTLPCGLELPNRLVKAAMTERLADVDGLANSRHQRLYRRFAQGGVGMQLTGNVLVDRRYLEAPGNVVIEDDRGLESLAAWARAGKAHGGAMIAQLNHAGRQTPRTAAAHCVAPSAVPSEPRHFYARPRAMSDEEIEECIARFAVAARIAERAGFDGVQIHAAHGYLFSQFLSPRANRRTDRWGGSIENRARLLTRTVDAVRAHVSTAFAVGVKLNVGDFIQGGLEPGDAQTVVRLLEGRGVDFFELSGGTHERPASFGFHGEQQTRREAYFQAEAEAMRAVTDTPLLLTGGLRRRETLQNLVARGVCDLVGMARPLAVEPDLPGRFLRSEAESARAITLRLPPSSAGALAELSWQRQQLVRMAEGREPDVTASPTLAMLRGLWEEAGFKRRRAAWERDRPHES